MKETCQVFFVYCIFSSLISTLLAFSRRYYLCLLNSDQTNILPTFYSFSTNHYWPKIMTCQTLMQRKLTVESDILGSPHSSKSGHDHVKAVVFALLIIHLPKVALFIPSASLIKKWHMSVITWPLSILTLGDGHFCHMKLGVWIFGGRYLWLLVSSLHIFSSCLHLSSMLWNHHWPYLHSPIGTKGWKIHIMLKIQLNWVKIAKQEFENTSVLQLCVCECIYMAKIDIPQFADDLLK